MSFNKKLIALLAMLIVCACAFFGCDGNGTTPEVTTTESGIVTDAPTGENTTTEAPSDVMDPEDITILVENRKVNFKIIRPDHIKDTSHTYLLSAQRLRTEIETLLGTAATLGNDFLKEGQEHDSEAFEILVGFTNYPETAQIAAKCGYGDYIIEVVGNKIVVFGYEDDAMSKAITQLTRAMEEGLTTTDDGTKIIKLKASTLNQQVSENPQLSELPVFEGGVFMSYYDAGNRTLDDNTRCDEIIIEKATADLFSAYLPKLESAGYTKSAESDFAGNKFATYTSSEYTVTAGYYKNDHTARLFIEPLTPELPESTNYTKVTTSQITMLGLEYGSEGDYTSNGLSVLIRLEDGRFIVVDGGFNRAETANHFFNTIKSQASAYTDKPVIAAWIITHAHGDHQGMLNGYYTQFKDKEITVESLIHSFISESEREKAVNEYSENFSASEGTGTKATYIAAKTLGATVYKAHVGQVFRFADLTMEVFFTHESYAPKTIHALNVSSNVFKMTFENDGKKTTYLCTGDATGHGMRICANMYGKYMQCDIVQVCHHGYSTWGDDDGMIKGYTKANPTLVLWPQGLNAYGKYAGRKYNSVLFTLPNYKECWVAGWEGDLVVVSLPYVYGESKIECTCTGKCPVQHNYN